MLPDFDEQGDLPVGVHRATLGELIEYDEYTKSLFDHLQSQSRFGASVFSIRPSTVLLETVDEFIAFWQIKRDQSEHGIVEIILE